MDDSDDFKKLSKQSKELDGKHDNLSGLQKLPTNSSISDVEKNGLEPKKDASIDEIDIVMSDAEKPLLDETKVDNHLAETDIQEPKHAIIDIVATANENVSQSLTNVDNDNNKQGMILVL